MPSTLVIDRERGRANVSADHPMTRRLRADRVIQATTRGPSKRERREPLATSSRALRRRRRRTVSGDITEADDEAGAKLGGESAFLPDVAMRARASNDSNDPSTAA